MQKLKLQKQFVVRGIICAWSDAYQWSCWSLHGGRRTDRFIALNCWCMPASCWRRRPSGLHSFNCTRHCLDLSGWLLDCRRQTGRIDLTRTRHPPGLDIRFSATRWRRRVLARNDGADELGAMRCACTVIFFCDHMDRGVAWGKRTGKNLARLFADCVLWLAGRKVCRAPTGIPCRSATDREAIDDQVMLCNFAS
jgi:hypothetical protein